MNAIRKKRGQYLGTRVEHKWWRRYTRGGFFTRGFGEYWIVDGSLFFQHRKKRKPFSLPLRSLAEIKLCPCHRRSAGVPVIKLVWEKDGQWLSSGFVISDILDDAGGLLASLRAGC